MLSSQPSLPLPLGKHRLTQRQAQPNTVVLVQGHAAIPTLLLLHLWESYCTLLGSHACLQMLDPPLRLLTPLAGLTRAGLIRVGQQVRACVAWVGG